MSDAKDLVAVTYLQIVRGDSPRSEGRGARVVNATATYPAVVEAGSIVIRAVVTVPVGAFRPIRATIAVPDVPAMVVDAEAEVPEPQVSGDE